MIVGRFCVIIWEIVKKCVFYALKVEVFFKKIMVKQLKKSSKGCMINMKITSQNPKKYSEEDKIMIIMRLKIHNFFAFKNFEMNMSYPKKIVDSYIEKEYLKDRGNFRYKKINILMGK